MMMKLEQSLVFILKGSVWSQAKNKLKIWVYSHIPNYSPYKHLVNSTSSPDSKAQVTAGVTEVAKTP